jgi:outer membrane biosynthesis protein TonB
MAALPVSPAGQPPAPAAGEKQPPKQGGGGPSGEDATKSNKLAIRSERSQYVAYVRQKIERINQRIMPKDYVETTIAREVVSVFSLVVERSGRVRAIRLEESCGYSTLDKIARQAISMAEPFEGYPAELPETFEMTVLVHYH